MNDMTGHNRPPEMVTTVAEVTMELSHWLAEHPVIEQPDQAKESKLWLDRAVLAVADLEDERKTIVHPLNEQLKKINDRYRHPRELLQKVTNELRSRLDSYIIAEEKKRAAAAEHARVVAADAERVAREAERIERDALASAAAGE